MHPLKNKEDSKKWTHKFERNIRKPKISNSDQTKISYYVEVVCAYSLRFLNYRTQKMKKWKRPQNTITGSIRKVLRNHFTKWYTYAKDAESHNFLFWSGREFRKFDQIRPLEFKQDSRRPLKSAHYLALHQIWLIRGCVLYVKDAESPELSFGLIRSLEY